MKPRETEEQRNVGEEKATEETGGSKFHDVQKALPVSWGLAPSCHRSVTWPDVPTLHLSPPRVPAST